MNLTSQMGDLTYEEVMIQILGAVIIGMLTWWVFFYELNPLMPAAVTEVMHQSRHGKLVIGDDVAKRLMPKRRFFLPKSPKLNQSTSIEIPGKTPALVFVNNKAGGNQGKALTRQLRQLLHPIQICDLSKVKPEKTLEQYRDVKNLRVIVCGGDGTVGWVMSAMIKANFMAPVAIIPLGTGNDLARVLGWGGGWSTGQPVPDILADVAESIPSTLDRWRVICGDGRKQPQQYWTNYVSIGADASVALRFHNHRKSSPSVYFSRLINKLWYVRHGLGAYFKQTRSAVKDRTIADKVKLSVDGIDVDLPSDTAGIIISNIPSYGGGAKNLWPGPEQVRFNDALFEVCAVTGVVHLTQIQLGLSSGIRLAQGSRLEMTTTTNLPMQIDGEPWQQPPSVISVTHDTQCKFLCRPSPHTANTIHHVQELLLWAEECRHISREQASILMEELQNRQESL
eukprot:TRINITY_DN847_c8_g1_i1.p1 TRINITY_DN847_c8_g1~~TRINITY_DN847_c8_g1_i1.p1  ORF type:complete len:468 (+),score=74.86 TRINITY_DN847_c8_g1_i1:48-1406(+)